MTSGKISLLTLICASMWATTSASASQGIVELGATSKSSVIQIGIAPETKPVTLDLGELRTGEAKLPFKSTVQSRMRKRAGRAIQRQRAVERAVRLPARIQSNDEDSGNGDLPDGFN